MTSRECDRKSAQETQASAESRFGLKGVEPVRQLLLCAKVQKHYWQKTLWHEDGDDDDDDALPPLQSHTEEA